MTIAVSPLPGTTISSLPTVTSLSGSEYFPLLQGGTTKRAAISQIGPFASGTIVNSYTTITDLDLTGGVYTVAPADRIILVNCTIACSIQLLTAASRSQVPLAILDISGLAGTNNITILRASTDTIDGATSLQILAGYGGWVLWPLNIGNWYVAP